MDTEPLVRRIVDQDVFLVNPHRSGEVHISTQLCEILSAAKPDEIAVSDIIRHLCRKQYRPMHLGWELLDKCQLKCPFCYIVGHSSARITRFHEAKPALDSLLSKGLLTVTLTGGEPTLHPDFLEIYSYLKSNGCLVDLYTNGCFNGIKYLPVFDKYPPYNIEVSIYGVTQEDFDASTRTTKKINYLQPLQNVLSLMRNGHKIVCKTHLNTVTQTACGKIKDWCSENDIPHFISTDIVDAYDGISLQPFRADSSARVAYYEQSEAYPPNCSSAPVGFRSCFPCTVTSSAAFITAAFELQACSEFRLPHAKYDIRSHGLDNALEAYPYAQLI